MRLHRILTGVVKYPLASRSDEITLDATAYRVNGLANVAAGANAAIRWAARDWGHASFVLAAQGNVLPKVAGSHLWLVPVTIGLRRH